MRTRTILLTGATGLLGGALLSALHEARIICLVRDAKAEIGDASRVVGDVSVPRFGLSDESYVELCSEIDAVVHMAAVTDTRCSSEQAYSVNVMGTAHVIDLARLSGAPLYHLSTAFVRHVDRATAAFAPYLSSKHTADLMVRRSGVEHVILRPSVIIGDSRSGEMARRQGFEMLAGSFFSERVPVIPINEDARVDFVPQDVVANVIARLVTEGRTGGELWLTAGPLAPTAQSMVETGMSVAEEAQIPIKAPRLIGEDLIERLVRPVVLPELPPRTRRRFEHLMELTGMFFNDELFPSDLERVLDELGLPAYDAAALRASLMMTLRRIIGMPTRKPADRAPTPRFVSPPVHGLAFAA